MALAVCAVYFTTSVEFINTDKLYFMIVQNGLISLKSLQQSNVCGSSYTSADADTHGTGITLNFNLHTVPVQGPVTEKS